MYSQSKLNRNSSSLDAFLTTTDILCNGAEDGQVITTITEGIEPYTYLWNNGATSKDLQALLPGITKLQSLMLPEKALLYRLKSTNLKVYLHKQAL